jgi:methyl-accepting chemotaxis protein
MRLSIGKRLQLGFGILLGIVLIFGLIIIVKTRKNNTISEKIINTYTPSRALLNKYYNIIDNSKMLIKSWVFIDKHMTDDKKRLLELQDSVFPALVAELDLVKAEWLEEDIKLVDEITSQVRDSLFVEHKKITTDLSSFESYDDLSLLFPAQDMVIEGGIVIGMTQRILDKLATLQGRINNQATLANEELKSSNKSFQTFTIVLFVILIISSLVTAFFTSRSILIPVNRLNNILTRMSKGEMPHTELVDTGDEIGQMSMSLNNVVNALRNIVAEIKDSALFLSKYSKTLTKQSKIISNGAGEQASYVQEINQSIEKIVSSLDMNAENSRLAEDLVLNFASSIQNNSVNVTKTFDALNKISEKVNDVNDIAFQTNILSLNAAIEAARAGEQGKGFGIVAQEVGKLAERSKSHANEIETLSGLSIDIARTTDEVSNGLIPQINKTQKLIGSITGAINDLSSDVNVIHKTAVNLNGIALQNSNFSGDMSKNSKELESKVESLMQSVSFFKINEEEMPGNERDNVVDLDKEEVVAETKVTEKKVVETKTDVKPFVQEAKPIDKGFDLDLNIDEDDNFETF